MWRLGTPPFRFSVISHIPLEDEWLLTGCSYIKSAIRSPTYEAELIGKGVEFAPQEDVAKCFMRIATDRTMNGYYLFSSLALKRCMLRISGHSLMITPASIAKEGFKDVDMDDHTEGYFKDTQELQLRIIEDQWVEGWSKGRTPEGGLKS